jgi:hypothetical protein
VQAWHSPSREGAGPVFLKKVFYLLGACCPNYLDALDSCNAAQINLGRVRAVSSSRDVPFGGCLGTMMEKDGYRNSFLG